MKKMSKKVKNVLVILFIFSLLQSYLFFLDEIATSAYAATADIFSQFIKQPEKNEVKEDASEEPVTDTNKVTEDVEQEVADNVIEENTVPQENVVEKEAIEEDKEQEKEELEAEGEPETEEENPEEDFGDGEKNPEENEEGKESGDGEEKTEESIASSLEILESYKTLEGAVIKTKIITEVKNVRESLVSEDVRIKAPQIEGYEVKNVYLENVELNDLDMVFAERLENNNVVIEVTAKPVEEFEQFLDIPEETENIEIEEVEETEEVAEILENFSREYVVVYELVGDAELNSLHLEIEEKLSYSENSVNLTSVSDVEVALENRVQNEYSFSTENASIYKGYLYANAISEMNYDTKYTSIDKVKVNSLENIDRIVVTEKSNVIRTKDEKTVDLSQYSRYNKTSVKVEEFNNIFGEKGYIEVFSNGESIGIINRNNKIENEKYIFEYPENINNMELSLVNMKKTGSIDILNNKIITGDVQFSRAQVINFDRIETEIAVQEFAKVMDSSITLFEINNKVEINLEDTESKMDLLVSTDTLSTSADNDVTFTITLKTDSERYELFRNPVIEITLPSDIESVNINSINLLYKNGLAIDKYEVIDGDFGEKMLRVKLTGTQEEYTPALPSSGTTVSIFTTMKLNRLTTNKESKIKFTYKNEVNSKLAYEVEGKSCVEIPVNFVSKYGLLRAINLNNIKTAESIISYDVESKNMQLEMGTNNQVINYKGTIVNNFQTTLNNVQIVGRIPTEGIKDGNSNLLETTFDAILETPVTTAGLIADIYYSEDLYAEKDSDSWTKETSDLSKYKSFKLVLKNTEMKQGESLEFSLNMRVPDNLGYNNVAYVTYTAYYEIDGQERYGISTDKLFTEVKETAMDEFADEEKENVENLIVATKVSQCGNELTEKDTIYERQIVEYTVYVQNNSNKEMKNVKIKADPENANLYYKYIFESNEYDNITMRKYYYYKEDVDDSKQYEEFLIDSLKPGEMKNFTYQAVVKEIEDNEKSNVYSNLEISADGIEATKIETIKNKIENTKVSLKIEWGYTQLVDERDPVSGSGLRYKLYVNNISDEILKDQKINFVIPNSTEYNDYEILDSDYQKYDVEITASGENTVLNINIPEIRTGEEKILYIPLLAKEIDTTLISTEMTFYAYTEIDGKQVNSNKYSQICYQTKTEIAHEFTADISENTILKDGDRVTYNLKIKNTGLINCNFIGLENNLQNGLILEELKLVKKGQEENIELDNQYRFLMTIDSLEVDEEFELKIITRVVEENLKYDQTTLENKITVSGGKYFEEFDTDVISLKVNNPKKTVDETEEPEVEEMPPPPTIEHEKTEENTNEDLDETFENNTNDDTEDEKYDEEDTNNNNNVGKEDTNNSKEENKQDTNNTINENNQQENNNTNKENNTQVDNNKDENKNTVSKKTYRINGKAWLDKNKDGIYSNQESLLSDIKVFAYRATADGKIIDKTIMGQASTSKDGKYEIPGLETGKYIIVFEYDNDMYSPTKYQANKSLSNQNSDVISKTMDGKKEKVAMTDTLEIVDATITNIDMGLILNNEFDFSMDKYIEKAIVSNSKGVEEVKFEKDDFVKLEINSKMFEKSSIDVVYEIVVKNEGEVSGYVSKVVDYIPEGMTFDSKQNKDWYQGNDGSLYYTGLTDKEIKAGQTKEIELVLHTESNTVNSKQIINTAEIAEISNEKALEDIDSKENNKVDTEDDLGKVEFLITVSTGKVINYTIWVIFIAIILAIAIIISPKIYKKIGKKKYK